MAVAERRPAHRPQEHLCSRELPCLEGCKEYYAGRSLQWLGPRRFTWIHQHVFVNYHGEVVETSSGSSGSNEKRRNLR